MPCSIGLFAVKFLLMSNGFWSSSQCPNVARNACLLSADAVEESRNAAQRITIVDGPSAGVVAAESIGSG
jgi:hypothetical protein